MLATGVITSNVQSVQAKTEVKQQSESELKHYYNKPVLERKNVTGYKYTEKGKDYIDVIVDNQYSQISLVGSDKDKFKDGDNSNIDVFILREGDSRQATNYSIGGVTKQTVNLLLTIYTPILEIKKGKEEPQSSLYQIYKEDISLKELDYRLRERAIKQHGLYSNGLKQGQITITMKDGKSHTIDLSQKLEKNVWVILSTADKYKKF